MYKCQCFAYNTTIKQFDSVPSITLNSLKITSLVNNILHKANIATNHKWQGQTFFGLNQQNVRQMLDRLIDQFKNKKNASISTLDTSITKICNVEDSNLKPQQIRWLGVDCYGTNKSDMTHKIGEKEVYIPDGFQSRTQIAINHENTLTLIVVTCKVDHNNCFPFICSADSVQFISNNPTSSMKLIFEHFKFKTSKNLSGYEFFGFHQKEVINKLSLKQSIPTLLNPALIDIINIQRRNAGPTSDMTSQRNQDLRNKKIHNMVNVSSFGDCKAYIGYVIRNFPHIVLDSIKENLSFQKQLPSTLKHQPTVLDVQQSASLLMSWTTLTQREYNSVRQILQKNNVTLATYSNVSNHLKNLNVGKILTNHCQC